MQCFETRCLCDDVIVPPASVSPAATAPRLVYRSRSFATRNVDISSQLPQPPVHQPLEEHICLTLEDHSQCLNLILIRLVLRIRASEDLRRPACLYPSLNLNHNISRHSRLTSLRTRRYHRVGRTTHHILKVSYRDRPPRRTDRFSVPQLLRRVDLAQSVATTPSTISMALRSSMARSRAV